MKGNALAVLKNRVVIWTAKAGSQSGQLFASFHSEEGNRSAINKTCLALCDNRMR
jgi:hypothetical protein